jgi:hypothetical protein
MIALEVFGETPVMTMVAERLVEIDGASRVRMESAVGDGRQLFSPMWATTRPIGFWPS